jgi:hypothetical protein
VRGRSRSRVWAQRRAVHSAGPCTAQGRAQRLHAASPAVSRSSAAARPCRRAGLFEQQMQRARDGVQLLLGRRGPLRAAGLAPVQRLLLASGLALPWLSLPLLALMAAPLAFIFAGVAPLASSRLWEAALLYCPTGLAAAVLVGGPAAPAALARRAWPAGRCPGAPDAPPVWGTSSTQRWQGAACPQAALCVRARAVGASRAPRRHRTAGPLAQATDGLLAGARLGRWLAAWPGRRRAAPLPPPLGPAGECAAGRCAAR